MDTAKPIKEETVEEVVVESIDANYVGDSVASSASTSGTNTAISLPCDAGTSSGERGTPAGEPDAVRCSLHPQESDSDFVDAGFHQEQTAPSLQDAGPAEPEPAISSAVAIKDEPA